MNGAADFGLLAAPLAVGLLVLATHVPLGIAVLRRGIFFIDLAVAQVATLGVLAAGIAHLDGYLGGIATQLAAGLAALAAAALLTWTERRWPELQEALIGLLFVLAASAGILMLAGNPHGGERLRDLLAGQILWVGWNEVAMVALLYAGLGAAWHLLPARLVRRRGAFYVAFSIAVTASVQLVGVYLVFASLIAPAVASVRVGGRRRTAVAFATGSACYVAGLLLSLLVDVPAAGTIVVILVIAACAGLPGTSRRSS